MGKTTYKYRDDDDRTKKNSRGAKHSRNIPGRGMRVINNVYDEDEDFYDDDVEIEEEFDIVLHKDTH